MTEILSLADKLAAARKKAAASAPTPPTAPVAPSPPPVAVTFMAGEGMRSEVDTAMDNVISDLDIIDAYNRFCGKSPAHAGGRTEGIKVSCPNPAHPDRNPSAWINTEKQTWYCGSCEMGGDKLDIMAWHFGMDVPGYKVGGNFRELRKRTAEALGYTVTKTMIGEVLMPPITLAPVPALPTSAPIEEPAESSDDDYVATVTSLPNEAAADVNVEIDLDWRPIVKPGTFLDVWMKQTVIDDVPEAYHFWNGLIAISMALGREVTLFDYRPVFANLYICILGRSGSGKSKAKYYLDQLLEKALPYVPSDPVCKGSMRVNSPASAEALIWCFQKRIEDPSTPGKFTLYPVKAVIDFNELSGLVGRANRQGSVLAPTLMQFYDAESVVETVSRTHGSEKAVEPYACAITTSQPRSLKTLLRSSDAASGFLNRWAYVVGRSKKPVAVGGAVVDIDPAVKPLQDIMGWAAGLETMQWQQDALEEFERFFHAHIHPVKLADETDLLNRIDLLCKKLVLLLSANMKHSTASLEAVKQMELLFPYIVECYGVPAVHVGSTLSSEVREAILQVVNDFCDKLKRGPTTRDIGERLRRRKYPLDLFNRTLKLMVESEELEAYNVNAGKPGRPSIRYFPPGYEAPVTAAKVAEPQPATATSSYFSTE